MRPTPRVRAGADRDTAGLRLAPGTREPSVDAGLPQSRGHGPHQPDHDGAGAVMLERHAVCSLSFFTMRTMIAITPATFTIGSG